MTPMERFRKDMTAFFDELSLAEHRPLVFGEGPQEHPVLMLIGEAPGEQEALQGRPFVGKAGKNLDALYDCLTDLMDVEITITAPEEDGAIFQKVLRVFKAADRENEGLKVNF